MIPTLDEFLAQKWPLAAYIDFPGFKSLYVRKSDLYVNLGGGFWRCTDVVQIANVEATNPGQGAFGKLIAEIKERGRAVYVELVHNVRFRQHLLKLGFRSVNEGTGFHYLWNFEGHLHEED